MSVSVKYRGEFLAHNSHGTCEGTTRTEKLAEITQVWLFRVDFV